MTLGGIEGYDVIKCTAERLGRFVTGKDGVSIATEFVFDEPKTGVAAS